MNKSKGFTLIEILLAMTIASVIIMGIHAAYRQARHLWVRIEASRPAYENARTVFETFRNELSCLYSPKASTEEGKQEDGNGSEKYGFELISSDNKVSMIFYTLAPCANTSILNAKIAKVNYIYGGGVFTRTEQLCAGEKTIANRTSQVLAQGLESCDIQVGVMEAEQIEWKYSYNTNDQLPLAIAISLIWPESKHSPANKFDTTFFIPSQPEKETSTDG
jgi:prepilin-type N-terminal cleavage/methylation domain-containing protein